LSKLDMYFNVDNRKQVSAHFNHSMNVISIS